MLEIRGVCKEFGDKTILKDINLTVENGTIVGLLGKNGAGKSTLIKCINQLYRFQGEIKVNGINYRQNSEKYLRNVGVLLEPSYYEYMSAIENLKSYASLSGVSYKNIENEMKALLDIMGLGDSINKNVSEFSFGMKQKLGVAMALAKKPDVLVLDEPTIGVDPKGLVAMFDILRDLAKKENTAIIFSSNNLKEVQDMSDRISFLKNGEIIQTVDTEKLLEKENSYVITVQKAIKEKERLERKCNCVVREKQISTENYKDMNIVLNYLINTDNPILNVERENHFLKKFYE
ncbi:ABC transporter ATP-binding protein [Mediterraneibacter agrestimuris]|uniref:ABC transporter ATP-binding protein n=1 Tax=Mediterraneibacter agrestimuris TaxID=2941333 RepID=UPI0020407309|nr:ABC transporter ATP-binding protein [Mediterraneibacter agrestimuris]